ncbi:hypothetical protein [Treponema primitia]|uniref:hypothetical protein n=1 Tax=Treponema primitia TaxID=88058 RepID=UPI00025553B9|nr:hypothetical protein [Treponema primitia]
MKPKPSGVMPPTGNQQRLFLCESCGHTFMGIKIVFPPKCPECGSAKVKEDHRAEY